MDNQFPPRKEIILKIDALFDGSASRSSISEWAFQMIDCDEKVADHLAWEVLEGLGAADLPAPDRDYLYTNEDFKNWKKRLISE